MGRVGGVSEGRPATSAPQVRRPAIWARAGAPQKCARPPSGPGRAHHRGGPARQLAGVRSCERGCTVACNGASVFVSFFFCLRRVVDTAGRRQRGRGSPNAATAARCWRVCKFGLVFGCVRDLGLPSASAWEVSGGSEACRAMFHPTAASRLQLDGGYLPVVIMLVSKTKPCMSKYTRFCTVKLRMAH